MDDGAAVEATRRWVADVVVGLNLCPFARRPFEAGLVRFALSQATTEEALLADLDRELAVLSTAARAAVETTLLIHPHVLADFLDYNDFLDEADRLLRRRRLDGVIQVASFHPDYRFAGTDPDAVENYTNRSPYPMLHLLREDSVTEVAADPERLLGIPGRNAETLRRLGPAAVRELLRRAAGAGPGPPAGL